MNLEEKLSACRAQLLYDNFLIDYEEKLNHLYNNASFMKEIREISERTAEELLYGCEIKNSEEKRLRFQRYKDAFCDLFFDTLRFKDYPDYADIYYSVKESGHSGKSATISIYYAMVYLDLFSEMNKKSTQTECNKIGISSCSDESIKQKFKTFLIKQGYSEYTPSGNESTVYAYIKGIDYVCDIENIKWGQLAEKINSIISSYGKGGKKEKLGDRSHKTVINSLLRYAEFISVQ